MKTRGRPVGDMITGASRERVLLSEARSLSTSEGRVGSLEVWGPNEGAV